MTSMEQQQSTNQVQRSSLLLVKDMSPVSRNFECEVIVLQKDEEPAVTREGDTIYRYLVADKTGSIILSVWGEMGRDIRGGDILRISGVHNKLRNGQLFISTLKSCKIKRVGQDTFPFVEKPNMSEIEYTQPPTYNNNRAGNGNNNNRHIPRQQQLDNNSNNFHNRQRGGYQNNNNNMSNNMSSNAHPYSNRGGRHHPRGVYNNNNNNNRNGRGGGNVNSRYHQDLDNPA